MTLQFTASLSGLDQGLNLVAQQVLVFRECVAGEVLINSICQKCTSGYLLQYTPGIYSTDTSLLTFFSPLSSYYHHHHHHHHFILPLSLCHCHLQEWWLVKLARYFPILVKETKSMCLLVTTPLCTPSIPPSCMTPNPPSDTHTLPHIHSPTPPLSPTSTHPPLTSTPS